MLQISPQHFFPQLHANFYATRRDGRFPGITQELHAARSQRGTLDAFLRFAKLMLVDVAAAWQRADAEHRLRVQNFLFQGGIAYHQNQKFLNTCGYRKFRPS